MKNIYFPSRIIKEDLLSKVFAKTLLSRLADCMASHARRAPLLDETRRLKASRAQRDNLIFFYCKESVTVNNRTYDSKTIKFVEINSVKLLSY